MGYAAGGEAPLVAHRVARRRHMTESPSPTPSPNGRSTRAVKIAGALIILYGLYYTNADLFSRAHAAFTGFFILSLYLLERRELKGPDV